MTKKEISQILGVDQNTIKNWEKNRPELHKIVMSHFDEPVLHELCKFVLLRVGVARSCGCV